MIEKAFVILPETIVVLVVGRNEAGAHLKERRIGRPLVVQHSGVAVFVVGHGHGPSGHLQQRLTIRSLDRNVGRRSGTVEKLRNINLRRQRFAGMVHSDLDDQARGTVDICLFVC